MNKEKILNGVKTIAFLQTILFLIAGLIGFSFFLAFWPCSFFKLKNCFFLFINGIFFILISLIGVIELAWLKAFK